MFDFSSSLYAMTDIEHPSCDNFVTSQEQPMCLEAAEALIELGVKINDVLALVCSQKGVNPDSTVNETFW
jgi:hypothetical protein